jgi:hypothetical protein
VNPLNLLYDAVAWVLAHLRRAGPVWTGQRMDRTLTIVLLVVFMRLLMVPLFITDAHHPADDGAGAADDGAAQEVQG